MMNIERLEVLELKAPLIQPFRIATGVHDSLDNLLVALTLSDGTVGYGEAAIASHITGETIEMTREHLKITAQCLKGQSAADYLRMSFWMHDSFPHNKAAVAAVETAILDALTKQMGVPLWKLFGARAHALQSDITIVIATLQETRRKAAAFYARGFKSFKIKVGKDMDLDIQRIQAVAQAAPASTIILDANQGYDVKQTRTLLKALEAFKIRIALIEQPVMRDDIEGLQELTRTLRTPVCADESASSLSEVVRLIRMKAVKAVNVKLMKTGIIHGFEIIRLARANGLKIMIGGMMESNVAMTAAAHLACGCGGVDFVDLDTPFFIKGEQARNPYLSPSGLYQLSKVKAGIGVEPRLK